MHTEPAESLPVLDEIIGRMLDAAGFDVDDEVARAGEEREVLDRYLAVHDQIVDGEIDESPGDVADAIEALTEVYEALHTELSGVAEPFEGRVAHSNRSVSSSGDPSTVSSSHAITRAACSASDGLAQIVTGRVLRPCMPCITTTNENT